VITGMGTKEGPIGTGATICPCAAAAPKSAAAVTVHIPRLIDEEYTASNDTRSTLIS
jgi:hypothetical protein